jgi:DNA-binding CsgD family transcriptional regulator
VSTVSTPPLVGRDLDLAVAREQLTRSARGTPASLLVRGEAGMGKSRLVAELAVEAGELGHPVVVGRADDLDHGIPFAAFRDLLARLDPQGPGADEADALRAAIEGHHAEADAEHLTEVFAAATRLLRALAGGGPLVLVLEDVHVADGESLALAPLLIRLAGLPVLTVVTLRPGGGATELEQLCERMAFEGRGSVVDLEPLDPADTRALAAAVIGAELDDGLTDAVVGASRGNPFFAGEVAQALVDGGAVAVADGRARLVPGAPAAQLPRSTALLRRLVLGTADDLELAKVMAVFGRFSLHHLGLAGRLTGQSADGVAESFDRLVASGLLAHAAGGGYEFTHSILRDRLYDDIGPAERRRIHAAIAADLAVERGGGGVLDVLELATHVAASAEPGDAAAAEVLLEAGRTVGATAPLVSADYHRRALELLPVDAPRRAEAQAGRARALHLGARPREAAAVGLEALAALPGGPARGAIAALVVNDLYLDGRAGDALGVIDAELAHGGDPCPLLAMRTNLALQSGRYAEAAETFGDAVAALDGADVTPAAELMALAHVVQYANHVGAVGLAGDLMRRVEALAEGASSTVGLAAHELVAFADWRPGLVARMEEHLRVASALRPEGAALSIGGSSEGARARVLWMRGRWDEALDLIGSAGFALDQRGTVTTAQLLACKGCEIFVDRGDLDDGAAMAELETLATRTGWLECQVPALRARALVDGDVDAARAYRGVAETESWEVERAHALLVLGELDDEPARNLAEAYRAFDSFGAAPWRRRAAAGLRARGLTVPRRAARATSELTETEVQLVRLVRDGLSNRQIAAAMSYSRKTIEVYLSRVYAKTGCASRLELIRAVDTGAVQVGGVGAADGQRESV